MNSLSFKNFRIHGSHSKFGNFKFDDFRDTRTRGSESEGLARLTELTCREVLRKFRKLSFGYIFRRKCEIYKKQKFDCAYLRYILIVSLTGCSEIASVWDCESRGTELARHIQANRPHLQASRLTNSILCLSSLPSTTTRRNPLPHS